MLKPACPKCRQEIPPADVNPSADVAFCRRCNLAARLSDLVAEGPSAPFDAAHPPRGVAVEGGPGGVVMRASHRSLAAAVGLLAMALFWNGITSIFVLLALASTLKHSGIALPDWFAAPELEGGNNIPLGVTIFLWIFLTPFIAVGLGLVFGFLRCLAGQTVVRLRPGDGSVFSGIGPLGRTRRFDPAEVAEVRLRQEQPSNSDSRRPAEGVFVLRDGGEIPFGASLNMERLRYLVAGARAACAALRA